MHTDNAPAENTQKLWEVSNVQPTGATNTTNEYLYKKRNTTKKETQYIL